MRSKFSTGLLGLALWSLVAAGAAHAQATRTWVSGVGDDANPCSRTAPCKTFAGAISKTANGGEIDALDPGSYGAVTITKSITIDGGGYVASALVSGTNGIVVNGSGIVVTLRNLQFEGIGPGSGGSGVRGIWFINGAALHVEHCAIRDFRDPTNGIGISITPTVAAQVFISDTSVTDSGSGTAGGGIIIAPGSGGSVQATLVRVHADQNTHGITADATAGGSVALSIIDSSASGNVYTGLFAASVGGGAAAKVMVNRTVSANNNAGLNATGGATVFRIGNSVVTGNTTGVKISGGATMTSYGTNQIDDNTSAGQTIPILGPT